MSQSAEKGLPPIPLDDGMLSHIEHALDACLTYEAEDGSELANPRVIGAEFTLPALLDFLSGYDPDDGIHIGYSHDGVPIYEHPKPCYSERDLIRALVAEVRRLRVTSPEKGQP